MNVVHPICCGMDVHKASITVCLRKVDSTGKVTKEVRTFGTSYRQLLELLDWLLAERCPVCAMESTGVYWKPVYHVLHGSLEVLVANAQEVKQRRGKKTDKADADWIAELLAHDLISPSFVPSPTQSALRDLVRMRVGLVQTRTQSKNRVHKILEDSNIKLSSVVSNLFGVSARQMLEALIQGERNPKVLAEMAKGVMRKKIPQLELALEGTFTEHHAMMIKLTLNLIDTISEQIEALEERIQQLLEPMAEAMDCLKSIPGMDQVAAASVLAEIGTDMSPFVSPGRLTSWAGLCPGNNESAGKRKSGKTRKGNKYLKRILVQCAWAARKTETFLGRTFRRLQARIGGKKAAVAVARKILVIVFHLLNEGVLYREDLYDQPNQKREDRLKKQALKTLEKLGYDIALTKVA